MSENKLKSRDAIDAELKKTKAELAIAKHREAKLRNQIKGMTEKERRHRNIVWGSHFEYLIREKLNVSKEQLAILNDDTVKDILNTLFSDLYFRQTMQNILTWRDAFRLHFQEKITGQAKAGRIWRMLQTF